MVFESRGKWEVSQNTVVIYDVHDKHQMVAVDKQRLELRLPPSAEITILLDKLHSTFNAKMKID